MFSTINEVTHSLTTINKFTGKIEEGLFWRLNLQNLCEVTQLLTTVNMITREILREYKA